MAQVSSRSWRSECHERKLCSDMNSPSRMAGLSFKSSWSHHQLGLQAELVPLPARKASGRHVREGEREPEERRAPSAATPAGSQQCATVKPGPGLTPGPHGRRSSIADSAGGAGRIRMLQHVQTSLQLPLPFVGAREVQLSSIWRLYRPLPLCQSS
jgi:hypothetical protein